MHRYSKTVACFAIFAMFVLEGCADSEEELSTNAEAVMQECGPNATAHGGFGPGAEAHCDCNSGYKLMDGECIADDSSELNNDSPDNDNDNDTDDNEEDDVRALPLSCWLPPGSTCDPRDGEGCDLDAGHTCDLGTTSEGSLNLVCLAGANTQRVDQTCDPVSGPFCAPGLHCVESGVCKNFCCGDNECGADEQCEAFSETVGALGVCDDGASSTPACASRGRSCQSSSECCSNDCHAGHCH